MEKEKKTLLNRKLSPKWYLHLYSKRSARSSELFLIKYYIVHTWIFNCFINLLFHILNCLTPLIRIIIIYYYIWFYVKTFWRNLILFWFMTRCLANDEIQNYYFIGHISPNSTHLTSCVLSKIRVQRMGEARMSVTSPICLQLFHLPSCWLPKKKVLKCYYDDELGSHSEAELEVQIQI